MAQPVKPEPAIEQSAVVTSPFGFFATLSDRTWIATRNIDGGERQIYVTFSLQNEGRSLLVTNDRADNGWVSDITYQLSNEGRVSYQDENETGELAVLPDGSVRRTTIRSDGVGQRVTYRKLTAELIQATIEYSASATVQKRRWSSGETYQLKKTNILPFRYIQRRSRVSASTVSFSDETPKRVGENFRDCAGCPEMVVLPAGTFMMGTPASEEGRDVHEGPRHVVTISGPFAIGRYEITFDEWNMCVADGSCHKAVDSGWGQGRRPATMISWIAAREFIDWLAWKTGKPYFFPSEAEWEYAARAGSDTPWNTGNAIISDDANILNQFAKTVPVGGYPANAWGLHDIHGNAAEWVQDCFDTGYFGTPTDGSPAETANCAKRVQRGGSFAGLPAQVRSGIRLVSPPLTGYTGVGIRVARAIK